jgi:hypothetical protein
MSVSTPLMFVVGAFPPPVRALPHANSRMAALFAESGFNRVLHDTAPPQRREKATSKLHRLAARISVLGKV